jgi:hypothetical protein
MDDDVMATAALIIRSRMASWMELPDSLLSDVTPPLVSSQSSSSRLEKPSIDTNALTGIVHHSRG